MALANAGGGGGGGSGGSAAPLAVVQYGPAAIAAYNVTNTVGISALDPANLTVSLTVPASGKVIVDYSTFAQSDGVQVIGLGLLNHVGGAQVGFTLSNVQTFTNIFMVMGRWYLTGLTPGALQLDMAAGMGNVASTGHIYAQGNTGAVNTGKVGPNVIVVWAA